ncbi:MAG: peroxiredoxin [Woeseiaceae bacterium]
MPGPTMNRVVKDFKAPATSDAEVQLKSLRGKQVVLYFYPKDSTPGCTNESIDFTTLYPKFKRANTVIFGISRDSLASHEKFKAKYSMPFELISDADEKLCAYFDVIKEKNMYGRKVMGIERSTFLIDADGKLREEWRKVKVKGHAEAVLEAAKQIA